MPWQPSVSTTESTAHQNLRTGSWRMTVLTAGRRIPCLCLLALPFLSLFHLTLGPLFLLLALGPLGFGKKTAPKNMSGGMTGVVERPPADAQAPGGMLYSHPRSHSRTGYWRFSWVPLRSHPAAPNLITCRARRRRSRRVPGLRNPPARNDTRMHRCLLCCRRGCRRRGGRGRCRRVVV